MRNISLGTPGMAMNSRPADFHPDAGGRARDVEDGVGTDGEQRLHAVAVRHHPAASREHHANVIERNRVFFQVHAGHGGECFPRQVVLSGAESAGGNDEVGPLARQADALDVVREIVGNSGVEADRDADGRELLAEPVAVRVEVLSAGDLAADREDFGFHSVCLTGDPRASALG